MDNRKFNLWNKVCALSSFLISAVTYLLTIEPSASFWDCGEFIASSYKLEVGHPPGNPVFQLIARFFTLFGDASHAAVLVNAMSAVCSALTVFLLYLTIVWLAKRLVPREADGGYSVPGAMAVLASGLVGSLAYCFSDTFWFSAVEGEVYAMSSLFTAFVFWAMTRWYDTADEPRSNKWIILIAFLMGLSIGVHLLNLLAIPALVFIFYYRRREDRPFKTSELIRIFLVGVVILAVILFAIIPLLPKLAAYFDLLFVNVFGLPYNTGAAFFMVVVLGLCFWGLFRTLDKGKVFWNTALLCLTTIIIGFSVFSIDIIRSCAKTPTNEYQPDNAFTLVRYLSREQYGKTPLLYGQYYDAPYELTNSKYWAPMDGKYKKVDGPLDANYSKAGKMLFPRMWSSSSDGRNEEFYKTYTHGKGTRVSGSKTRKPTMGANLCYFLDFQCGWMYWRYFMWNFVGRQNDIHAPSANLVYGNWESGIGFLDKARLGDQDDAPAVLRENKGKNHYFFLPLILGLIGLCFQFGKDKRGCWLTFLMFFMTGLAIVIYLNQPPYQVRERDYAYAGSFYFFAAWIGLGVAALCEWISQTLKGGKRLWATVAACLVCMLCVPVLMAAQNWDDHDRSGRKTAVEVASNYLESVGPNGILITHGDNDTFPVWYAQEVESIRTDVRLCNTSLLGTDWHIDQMKWASNASSPLPLTVPYAQYLYGTNEYVPIVSDDDTPMPIDLVMDCFKDPKMKVGLASGRRVDYIPARRILIPVNAENAVSSGIISPKYASMIPESIVLTIPEGKDFISKPELFMLDLLAGYDWSRPIHMLNMGGDLNIGLREYLEFCGYSYKFIPFKNTPTMLDAGWCDVDALYARMTDGSFKWDALAAPRYFIDYQNLYTNLGVMSVRQVFVSAARAFLKAGHDDWAMEMYDKAVEVTWRYPLETVSLGFDNNDYMVMEIIGGYYGLGAREKAQDLVKKLSDSLFETTVFYLEYYEYFQDDFKTVAGYIYHLADITEKGGDVEVADAIRGGLQRIYDAATKS
ncbi:MAG: DUF2723 domain-containing protein [Bacteroidales bacterium]|nr:DUF2723 domain-containing protein [Bacteroidales bacterium]